MWTILVFQTRQKQTRYKSQFWPDSLKFSQVKAKSLKHLILYPSLFKDSHQLLEKYNYRQHSWDHILSPGQPAKDKSCFFSELFFFLFSKLLSMILMRRWSQTSFLITDLKLCTIHKNPEYLHLFYHSSRSFELYFS